MTHSSWRVLIAAALIAVLVGGLGFAAGYAARPLLAASSQGVLPSATATVPATPTATPIPPTPTAPPTETPLPTEPPPTASPTPAAGLTQEFDRFWEVWGLITRDYYGEIPDYAEVVDGAIRGALNTLGDPNTGYIAPGVAAISREDMSGSFEGIGAFVSMEDGQLSIVEPMKGQPAESAGLRRGDIVAEVDGTRIENMSVYEAIALIRGPAGTQVRLRIVREGEEPFEVEITRARIDVAAVESELRPDGIAYARLIEFTADASVELEQALESLQAQNPKGLILDLRGNPGGWLNQAVLTAGLFLPEGSLVLIERSKEGDEQQYTTPDQPIAPDVEMVVLVDAGSASASEIVAGALQDLGRAKLIGEKTFGKGSVQLPEELSNGGELRVTVAHWFTPKDRAIHGQGLEPDISVELTAEDEEAGRDPQLDRAVQYLLTGQ